MKESDGDRGELAGGCIRLTLLVVAPAGRRAVRAKAACMPAARGDRGELAGRRVGLPVLVVAPAGRGAVRADAACMQPARGDGGEGAGRRAGFPVLVVAPAGNRAVGADAARVTPAEGEVDDPAVRSAGLLFCAVVPAGCLVGMQSAWITPPGRRRGEHRGRPGVRRRGRAGQGPALALDQENRGRSQGDENRGDQITLAHGSAGCLQSSLLAWGFPGVPGIRGRRSCLPPKGFRTLDAAGCLNGSRRRRRMHHRRRDSG